MGQFWSKQSKFTKLTCQIGPKRPRDKRKQLLVLQHFVGSMGRARVWVYNLVPPNHTNMVRRIPAL